MITELSTANLIDFSEPRTVMAWFVLDDGVMGGISRGLLRATVNGTVLFSGTVRLENNGGFSSIQTQFRALDLSRYGGVVLHLRGDGREYAFNLRQNFGPLVYEAPFTTQAGAWQQIAIPFSSLQPNWFGQPVRAPQFNAAQVVTASMITALKQPGSFALELARIDLYCDGKLV